MFSATAPAGVFTSAFVTAARVSPKSGPIPIMSNLRLAAAQGANGLTVAGRNADAVIMIRLDVNAKGSVTAPADRLAAIAGRLDPEQPMIMTQEGSQLIVKQGRTRFALPTMPADALPISLSEASCTFDVDADEFRRALKAVERATGDPGAAHGFLSGIYLDLSASEVRMVATDGKILGATPIDTGAPPKMEGVIIPWTAFPVLHALADDTDVLRIGTTASALIVSAGAITYESKVIDAHYPKWRQLVPSGHRTRARIPGDAMRKALEQLGALGPSEITLTIRDHVTVTAVAKSGTNTIAEAEDVIEIEGRKGDPAIIRLNSDQVAWVVASLPGAPVFEVRIGDDRDPVQFVDDERPDDVRLLMTLRG